MLNGICTLPFVSKEYMATLDNKGSPILKIPHPLVNPKASHYDHGDGLTTIEIIEGQQTICELVGACKFNITKYSSRNKGQDNADAEKVRDYTRYMQLLMKIGSYDDVNVFNIFKDTCKDIGLVFDYTPHLNDAK